MKFCTKCGHELNDGAVICTGCGCMVGNDLSNKINGVNTSEAISLTPQVAQAGKGNTLVAIFNFIFSVVAVISSFFLLYSVICGHVSVYCSSYSYYSSYCSSCYGYFRLDYDFATIALVSSFCSFALGIVGLILSLVKKMELKETMSSITRIIISIALIWLAATVVWW